MFTTNNAKDIPTAFPVFEQKEDDQDDATKLVAVYGTLRKGGGAEAMLRSCKHVGTDRVNGTIYDLNAFPGIRLGGQGEVVVDLFELADQKTLSVMDCYEGYHPWSPATSLYVRKVVETIHNKHKAWIYEYNYSLNGASVIESGDWIKERS